MESLAVDEPFQIHFSLNASLRSSQSLRILLPPHGTSKEAAECEVVHLVFMIKSEQARHHISIEVEVQVGPQKQTAYDFESIIQTTDVTKQVEYTVGLTVYLVLCRVNIDINADILVPPVWVNNQVFIPAACELLLLDEIMKATLIYLAILQDRRLILNVVHLKV